MSFTRVGSEFAQNVNYIIHVPSVGSFMNSVEQDPLVWSRSLPVPMETLPNNSIIAVKSPNGYMVYRYNGQPTHGYYGTRSKKSGKSRKYKKSGKSRKSRKSRKC
jgi:hypothetical protein